MEELTARQRACNSFDVKDLLWFLQNMKISRISNDFCSTWRWVLGLPWNFVLIWTHAFHLILFGFNNLVGCTYLSSHAVSECKTRVLMETIWTTWLQVSTRGQVLIDENSGLDVEVKHSHIVWYTDLAQASDLFLWSCVDKIEVWISNIPSKVSAVFHSTKFWKEYKWSEGSQRICKWR